ncbi:MAG: tol-pal system YbgF family protein [Sandaracinaceae bacterium]
MRETSARLAEREVCSVAPSRIAIAIACTLLCSIAHAQEGGDAEARARFEAGRLAFDAGRFEDALTDFRLAYELSHQPVLLYNIGETAARLERRREALEAFEAYLRDSPSDSPHRSQVEARVAILRSSITSSEPPPTRPRAPSYATPEPTSIDPAPWVVVGFGAAFAIAGAILIGVAESDRSAVENARPPTFYTEAAARASEGEALEGVGITLLCVGVVGAIAGIVWGIAAGSRSDHVAFDLRRLELRWSL